jgi:hypothetical protein
MVLAALVVAIILSAGFQQSGENTLVTDRVTIDDQAAPVGTRVHITLADGEVLAQGVTGGQGVADDRYEVSIVNPGISDGTGLTALLPDLAVQGAVDFDFVSGSVVNVDLVGSTEVAGPGSDADQAAQPTPTEDAIAAPSSGGTVEGVSVTDSVEFEVIRADGSKDDGSKAEDDGGGSFIGDLVGAEDSGSGLSTVVTIVVVAVAAIAVVGVGSFVRRRRNSAGPRDV